MAWRNYERRKAEEHKGRHCGEPGEPDYRRGRGRTSIRGEVKAHHRPLTWPQVRQEIQKGRNEIISKRGFTSTAISKTKRYHPKIRLIDESKHKQKRIV